MSLLHQPNGNRKRTFRHVRRTDPRICSDRHAGERCSHCVLRGGAQIRLRRAESAQAGRRPDRARRGGRPLQGQEWGDARHRRAGRARRCRASWWLGSARPATSSRKATSSSAASRWAKCPRATDGDDRRRPAGRASKPERAADLALGVRLRAYWFDRYKTKRKEGEEPAETGDGHDRGGRRSAPTQKAFATARRGGGRRAARARPGQRAAPTCSIRIEFASRASAPGEARRRRRGVRRRGDEEARHERAARRRAGLGAREPRW